MSSIVFSMFVVIYVICTICVFLMLESNAVLESCAKCVWYATLVKWPFEERRLEGSHIWVKFWRRVSLSYGGAYGAST